VVVLFAFQNFVCVFVFQNFVKPMAQPVRVSELADDLADDLARTDLFDGPGSDDDSAGSSAPEGGDDRSSSGGGSLDSTYLLQGNAVPFYQYAAPSVISQREPHDDAPARPVFGCVARSEIAVWRA
jgi:hypothetical protein